MKKAWELIWVLLGFVGFGCVYLAVSTSDYYVLELGQDEPQYVWSMLIVGFVLMLPALLTLIFRGLEASRDVLD